MINLLRRKKLVFILIILVAVSVIIVVQFFRFGQKDTEWVNDVNAFIEDKKPFPDEPVSSLAIFQFYYNGSLIHHTSNSLNPLVVKITDILNRASWVINCSENRQFLDELLEDSTYLHALFRPATSFSTEHNVKAAYFILNNNLNTDLKATVIMYSFTVYANASEKEVYSLREVVK